MMTLDEHLKLDRCPHCSIDNPNLLTVAGPFETKTDQGYNTRYWRGYQCRRCGGVVFGEAIYHDQLLFVQKTYPEVESVNEILPGKVKIYLQQAIEATHVPAGAVMLCASAVDAMLKEKGYKEGSLYKRIDKAVKEALLTDEMGKWAHQVRLDANDQRHSDEEADLPTVEDAKQSIEFAKTLAEFLFVLPAKVSRGIAQSSTEEKKPQNPN